MKHSSSSGKYIVRQSARTGLLLVLVAALTLAATSLIQSYYMQKGLQEEASRRADSHLNMTRDQILDVIDQAEMAVRNNVWIARWSLENRVDSLPSVSRRIVEENDVVVGSTLALVPGFLRGHHLYAPYFYQSGDSLSFRSLATKEYDYPSKEWFAKAIDREEGYWSEPYVDTGGGEMLMTTFSLPIKDSRGKTAAILTSDISLDWLTDLVTSGKVYPNAINVLISRQGRFMVSPQEELIMVKTVDEIISQMKDSVSFRKVYDAMLNGRSGNMPVYFRGEVCYLYYAPVEKTGWSMCILVPDKDIYGGMRRIGWLVRLLQLLGLAMVVLILRSFIRNQNRYNELNERKKRMEGELHIAQNIQMSMVPKTFPPFPDRNDLDLAAAIIPAKEVGGDLYDFFIRDGKLFFCIGDVSGKGVPAALVMAVTRTTFRNIAARENSPGHIVTLMNDNLSAMNDNNMFVTFFCGVMDLSSGHLRFCNAGHNPPRILTDAIQALPVVPNLPLGVQKGMSYAEQDVLLGRDDAIFLYTDGLTEAENASHEQFGEARMDEALRGRKSAEAHLDNIEQHVSHFVGDAPRSDDLTMLFIHYLGGGDSKPRHLTLHNDIKQISLLHGFVKDLAAEAGISPELCPSLNLALEEAVTNVILYAYPAGTDGTVDIDALLTGDELSFVISDSGKPFDPTKRGEVDIHADLAGRKIGGLGIHLIRSIMDTVRYERKEDRNILTITKKI